MIPSRFRRTIFGTVLFCFCIVFLGTTIFVPRVAQAIPVEDLILEGKATRDEVQLTFGQAVLSSAVVGLINAITLAGQQFAYDLAAGLASGFKGQNPFAFLDNPGEYATKVAYSAAGEFIYTLSGPWESLGLNLCSPRLPSIGLAINLGLAYSFQRPEPKCDFVRTVGNWQNIAREVRNPHALLQHLSFAFDPAQTDVGQALRVQETFRIKLQQQEQAALVKRIEGNGILPQEGLISGHVTTPAAVMKSNFEELAKQGKDDTIKTSDIVASTIDFSNPKGYAVWSAVGSTILNTFTNSLISNMLKVALSGLFADSTPAGLPDLTKLVNNTFGGEEGAAPGLSPVAFSLLTPQVKTPGDNYEYLAELAACPSDRKSSTQFNCTIDSKFMQALERASTGRAITVAQAMQLRLLDPAKPFGFADPASNPPTEPDFKEGYPYSAMKRLRLLGVLPVGWEFAAQKIDSRNRPATLKDVIDGWSDPSSDFFGMIDPNWILKAPQARCGAQVYGAVLDATKTGRQEECVDLQHCVSKDSQGTCNAYGYCTKERNIWNIDGDACSSQFASCDTFKKEERQGAQEVSLLENTVDYGACNADNAGCTAYRREQTATGTAALAWNASSPRLYLDRDAPQCDASADGCREFINPRSGSLNLLPNPGFEDDANNNSIPDAWTSAPASAVAPAWISNGTGTSEGRGAIRLDGTGVIKPEQAVMIRPNSRYTLSFYAKGGSSASDKVKAFFVLRDSSGGTVPISSAFTSCTVAAPGQLLTLSPFAVVQNSTSYARASCTFTAPAGVDNATFEISREGSSVLMVDALQFEESNTLTSYHAGYTGTTNIYYRTPPDYLHCTGELTDRSECSNFAAVCRRQEVGCTLYTPQLSLASLGGTEIPGVVTPLDTCDKDCAGYASYLKQSSRFEPQFTSALTGWPAGAPEEGSYLIIPSRARACSAIDAGCDEFTNLRTETREYYSNLRACQRRDATDTQTYYTWEGAEQGGYQLKTWLFKKSNASSVTGDTVTQAPATPPCTNYTITTSSGTTTVTCTDETEPQAVCSPSDLTLTPEARADCRAFYDSQNNIFYRFMSRTIVATDECQTFRWSGLPKPPEVQVQTRETTDALRIRLEHSACDGSHGSWDNSTSQCIYLGAPSLSKSCSAQVSGCRGFKGTTGGNVEDIVNEGFEGTTPSLADRNWSAQGTAAIASSPEALRQGQRSLRVTGAGQNAGAKRTLPSTTPPFTPGTTYFVSFLIKGTVDSHVEVFLGANSMGSTPANPEWRYVELGPVVPSSAFDALTFRNTGTDAITFYLDDVHLTGTHDTVYLVKNSSVIPPACDRLPAVIGGGYARGAQLGCRAYTSPGSTTPTYLKSFSSLCRRESVGCTDLIDTEGSASVTSETFNTSNTGICRGPVGDCVIDRNGDGVIDSTDNPKVCTITAGHTSCAYSLDLPIDNVTVPADAHRYIVVKPEVACTASQKGCMKLGSANGTGGFEDVYLRNDPTRYATDLCQHEEEGCAVWRRSDQSQAFFKDPSAGYCDWRTNVKIGTQTYSGWLRKEKQPIKNQVAVANKEWCSGYGNWNAQSRSCIDPTGTTITNQLPLPSCGSCGEGATPSCAVCADFCNYGTGGTWMPGMGTSGTCMADTPCYGDTVAGIFFGTPFIAVFPHSLCVGGSFSSRQCGSTTGGDTVTPNDCVSGGGTCTQSPYISSGTQFGLWHNGDAAYQGRVGRCPKEESTCTEFIDPTDTSNRPEGKSYYRKDNPRLHLGDSGVSGCNGKVSRKEGCVLFDNVENPSHPYAADPSYALSEQGGGSLVDPREQGGTMCRRGVQNGKRCVESVTAPAEEVAQADCTLGGGACRPNDNANTILKVVRDRECSEWLRCRSAELVWQDQKFKSLCTSLGRCAELPLTTQGNDDLSSCGKWITDPAPHGPLTSDAYKNRDKSFHGDEYLGYSIPDAYPVEKLREVNLGSISNSDYRLAYVLKSCNAVADCPTTGNYLCQSGLCVTGPLGGSFLAGKSCTSNTDCPTGRTCEGGTCTTCSSNADCTEGKVCIDNKWCTNDARRPGCRAFQDRTSPFPNTDQMRALAASAPLCDAAMGTPASNYEILQCGCGYQKAEYGTGGTKYYNTTAEEIPTGQCVGGIHAGDACTTSEQCSDGGSCEKLSKQTTVIGWQGYCLEEDPSKNIYNDPNQKACLTWMPIDLYSSSPDIYNQFAKAGYQIPAVGGQYWCLQGGAVQDKDILHNIQLDVNSNENEDDITVKSFNVSDFGIYQYQIKGIVLDVETGFCHDGACYRSTDALVAGSPSGKYYLESGNTDPEHKITGTTYNYTTYRASVNDENAQMWWWGADNNSRNTDGDGHGNVTGEGTPHLDQLRDVLIMHPENGENINCGPGWNVDEAYDGQAILFNFDPTSKKLKTIKLGFCSGSDMAGSADGSYDYFKVNSIKIRLHPQCNVITRIDPLRSAPATNLLWSATAAAITHDGTTYTQATPINPFGSSPSHTNPPTSGNDNPWFLNWNRMEADAAIRAKSEFAGWPFSCATSPASSPPFTSLNDTLTGVGPGRTCVDEAGREVDFSPFGASSCDGEDTVAGGHFPVTSTADGALCISHNSEPGRRASITSGFCDIYETREHLCTGYVTTHRCVVRAVNTCTVNTITSNGNDGKITEHLEAPLVTGDPTTIREVLDSGTSTDAIKDDFSKLFARSFRGYTWETTPSATNPYSGHYKVFGSVGTAANPATATTPYWDIRYNTPAPPSVHTVPGDREGVTVNGLSSGNVVGYDGFLRATLEFYGQADANHMPIRRVLVDWGDNTDTSNTGLYQNHLKEGQCNGRSFGTLNTVSCVEKPFTYTMTYFCERGIGPNWNAGELCPEAAMRDQYGGCCVFKPAVQVRDNWGYCNGGYGRTYDERVNVNAGPLYAVDEECDYRQPGYEGGFIPWTPFEGNVVVAPRR